MKKFLKFLCVVGIAVGIGLVIAKVVTSFQYHVVPATITAFEESAGQCRRRTGKIETCTHFDVQVSYKPTIESGTQSDVAPLTATLSTDSKNQNPKVGDIIHVFLNKNDPADVRIDVLREGWKTPLSVIVLSIFALLVLNISPKRVE